MMKKQISKITMLTCLMLAGFVNAQEFYTCVPKKSWWKDTMSESIKSSVPSASDIARAVSGAIPKPQPTPTPQQPSSGWKLIKKMQITNGVNIPLTFGKYKSKLCNNTYEFNALDNEYIKTSREVCGMIGMITNHCSYIKIPEHHKIKIDSCANSILELYKYE